MIASTSSHTTASTRSAERSVDDGIPSATTAMKPKQFVGASNSNHAHQQPATGWPITVSTFLHETWMPRKRRQVRATTAYRYAWFIKHYITPAIGDIPLRRLRVDHLEHLYQHLARDRRPTPRRARTQDDPRSAHDRPSRARPRHRTPTRHPQRRRQRTTQTPTRRRSDRPAHGQRLSLQLSSPTLATIASTPPCTSPLTPACAEARSSDSNGATSTPTARRLSIRRTGAMRRRATRRVRRQDPHQPTHRRTRPSNDRPAATLAATTSHATAFRTASTTGCSATRPAATSTHNRLTQLFDRIVAQQRPPTNPIPRPAPHPRLTARRLRRIDQGRVRTTRSRPPGVHDAHLPTPATRHERRGRRPLRHHDRHRQPVDVYRHQPPQHPRSEASRSALAGRRRR